jgi:hypothetical protein
MADSAVLRRSLSPGQRAAITLEFAEMVDDLRKEAKERQKLAGEMFGRGKSEKLNPELGEAIPKTTTSRILAEKAGIGKSSMEYLMSVQREAPDLFEQVKSGEISINKAYKAKKKREKGEKGTLKTPVKSKKFF